MWLFKVEFRNELSRVMVAIRVRQKVKRAIVSVQRVIYKSVVQIGEDEDFSCRDQKKKLINLGLNCSHAKPILYRDR